jgi:serine protease
VLKVCEAGTTICSNEATVEITTAPSTNTPPTADFTSSCSGLTCTFTDRSTDGDGSVVGWQWAFGDGATSTARNPSRTYGTAGTYTVTLTATDDEGATDARSASVTVTAASSISLTATGRKDATTHYVDLVWTGATGDQIEVWRNGLFLTKTPNDGSRTITRAFTKPATYTFKICQVASTVCSNTVTVTIN